MPADKPPARFHLEQGPEVRESFRKALAAWFAEAGRDLPWRRTHDPYAIFVSELMLQQTQVATVIPFFERWLARFPTVETLAAATEAEVLSHWQGLGYYARARNLHRAARWLVAEHAGRMPQEPAALRQLPGAGAYTAGAIASFAFDLPAAAVDANIARVLARLFDVQEPIDGRAGQQAVWAAAALLLPAQGGRRHNSALMELGALLCTARQPRCAGCPVQAWCATELPEELPRKKPRRQTVALLEESAWIRAGERLLLRQQSGTRWAGLWKLPPAGPTAGTEPPLWEATYPFTHHRVHLRVRPEPVRPPEAQEEWFAEAALAALPMPSPHRRAVEGLLAAERSAGELLF